MFISFSMCYFTNCAIKGQSPAVMQGLEVNAAFKKLAGEEIIF